METNKLINLLHFYDKILEEKMPTVRRHESVLVRSDSLEHARWMCVESLHFIEDGLSEKAERWVKFIQGILYSNSIFTIDELKNHLL